MLLALGLAALSLTVTSTALASGYATRLTRGLPNYGGNLWP